MKIRTGFITNSSSTNFLIISKHELTEDYLFHKLGFRKGSPLEESGRRLCAEILYATHKGLRYYDDNMVVNFETILKEFGKQSAEYYRTHQHFHTYWGYTSSEDTPMLVHFTMDSFEINQKDFYLNGRSCMW